MELKRIREPEVKKILRAEFKMIKKKTSPRLDHIKFRHIKFFWWFKPARKHERVYGRCNILHKRIYISRRYYDRNGFDDFVNLLRHEILHLIEIQHNSKFKALCKFVGTTRFANTMKDK